MSTLLVIACLLFAGLPTAAYLPLASQAAPQTQTKQPPRKPRPINPDETGGPRGDGVMLRGTVVDASGKELAEVKVAVAAEPDPKRRWETSTDENGRFQLADLPVGLFTLELSRDGYRTGRHTHLKLDSLLCSVRVALQPGQSTQVVTERFSELRGRVRDAAGDPVPEAQVEIRGGTFARGVSLLTDIDGEFHLPNIQSGEYVIRASAAGYATVEKPLRIKPDGDGAMVSVNLDLARKE